VPVATPPLVAGALRAAKAMREWDRAKHLEHLNRYYEGKQYEDRDYDWEGYRLGLPGFGGIPLPPTRVIPISRRKPPANYRLGKIIVQRYTSLMFGEGDDALPKLLCEEDPDSEDFAQAIASAAGSALIFQEARDNGGAMGTGVVSWAWVDGEPRIEVHDPRHTWVLEWADAAKSIPKTVVKIWPTCEPGLNEDGQLVMVEAGWRASGARVSPARSASTASIATSPSAAPKRRTGRSSARR
jgi:hypothetical protein